MIPSVLYVILTCEKYKHRQKLQLDTWIKYIGGNDNYLYLSDIDGMDIKYENVAIKYINFIKSCTECLKFDWVFFCDDDTFVFPKKLGWLLKFYDKNMPLIIGRKGIYNGWELCSGGAGFAVSKQLFLSVKRYLAFGDNNILPNSDTSFGMWAKKSDDSMLVIDNPNQFQTQHPRHSDNEYMDIDSIISMHYCDEQDFKILSKYLKYNIN